MSTNNRLSENYYSPVFFIRALVYSSGATAPWEAFSAFINYEIFKTYVTPVHMYYRTTVRL